MHKEELCFVEQEVGYVISGNKRLEDLNGILLVNLSLSLSAKTLLLSSKCSLLYRDRSCKEILIYRMGYKCNINTKL